jgi:hypothetical protein
MPVEYCLVCTFPSSTTTQIYRFIWPTHLLGIVGSWGAWRYVLCVFISHVDCTHSGPLGPHFLEEVELRFYSSRSYIAIPTLSWWVPNPIDGAAGKRDHPTMWWWLLLQLMSRTIPLFHICCHKITQLPSFNYNCDFVCKICFQKCG